MAYYERSGRIDYDEKTDVDRTRRIRTRRNRRRRRETDLVDRGRNRRRKISNTSYTRYVETGNRRMPHTQSTEQNRSTPRRTPQSRTTDQMRPIIGSSSLRRWRQRSRAFLSRYGSPGTPLQNHDLNRAFLSTPDTPLQNHDLNSPTLSPWNLRRQRRTPLPQRRRPRLRRSPRLTANRNHQERRSRSREVVYRRQSPRRSRRLRSVTSNARRSSQSYSETDRTLAMLSGFLHSQGEEKNCGTSFPSSTPLSSSSNPGSRGRVTRRDLRDQIRSDEQLARSLQLSFLEDYADMDDETGVIHPPEDDIFARHLRSPFEINNFQNYHRRNFDASESPEISDYPNDLINNFGSPGNNFLNIPGILNHRNPYQMVSNRQRFPSVVEAFNRVYNLNEGHMSEERKESRGADQHVINELPTRKFKVRPKGSSERNYQESCCVCMEDFQNDEKVRTLPCMHFFHTGCIDKWLMRNRTCPVCKYDITHSHNRSFQEP